MQQQSRAMNNTFFSPPQDQSPLEFFKVYIPSFSSHKLLMPVDFVKKYKRIIPSKAILKDQTGRSWNINIAEVGSDLFFTKGWQDFVHDKFLEFGDFLIFRFDRTSIFHVKIFGRNGCKKEGVPKARVKMEQYTILEPTTSRPTCGFREEQTDMEQVPIRTAFGFREEDSNMEQVPVRPTHSFREEETNIKQVPSGPTHGFREEETNIKQVPKGLTHGFREEETNIKQVPSGPTHGFREEETNIKQVPKGLTHGFREEETNMKQVPSEPTHGFREEKTNGFREEETNIKQVRSGPTRTCDFRQEYSDVELVIKGTTRGFREEDSNVEQSPSRPTRCCKRKFSNLNIETMGKLGSQEAIPAMSRKLVFQEENMENNVANLVVPRGPHFVAPLSAYSSCHLHIPSSLLKEFHIILMENMNLRDQNGKLWPVSVSSRRDGRTFVTSGWREFLKQNNLQMHDHCVIELVLGHGNVCGEMEVRIYRAGLVTQKHNKYVTMKT